MLTRSGRRDTRANLWMAVLALAGVVVAIALPRALRMLGLFDGR